MTYAELPLTSRTEQQLLKLSADWAAENSCRGYYPNAHADLEGNRFFFALDGDRTVGYLFGHCASAERDSTVMKAGTAYFEVEELYIIPSMRSQGVGAALFRFAEEAVKSEASFILLTTATRSWKAILHFYIEELGMEFWSARLFKDIGNSQNSKK